MRSPATRYQNNTGRPNEIHNRGLNNENGTLCLTRRLECDTDLDLLLRL